MPGNIELIARLLFAAVLGGVIGFERERFAFPAGLRTHMLVCVASSLVMIVSAFGFEDTRSMPNVALDPSRVAAQVVSGIGFLGAGAILLRGEVVRGLTTAASVWAVAGIGLAAGGGLYVLALAATVIILTTLTWVKPVARQLRMKGKLRRALRLQVDRGAITLPVLCRRGRSAAQAHERSSGRRRTARSRHNFAFANVSGRIRCLSQHALRADWCA
jgi:putative Mg2+ transporter-C (MgtC) family protein